MKRTSLRKRTKKFSGGEANPHERSMHQQPNSSRRRADSKRNPKDNDPTHNQSALEQTEVKRIKELPKEVGIMLITAGIMGLILPGPGTPALIAGGLALWPKAFDKLESWLERHHPVVHHESMKQVDRFLDDLERRYPYSRYERGKR